MRGTGRIRVEAPAKVNLVLRVLEREASGFHAVETLYQAVDLRDELRIEAAAEADGKVELRVEGAELGPPEDNLVHRACEAFLEEVGSGRGLRVELVKRIPAGAGLGGGSSDAAAALRALNALFGEAVATERLAELGAALGSDVPFFLGTSALAVGRGRGERLTPLRALPPAPVLLAAPPLRMDTAEAYAELDRSRETTGVPSRSPLPLPVGETGDAPPRSSPSPPAPYRMGPYRMGGTSEGAAGSGADAGSRGGSAGALDWETVAGLAENDFELVVAERHRAVADLLAALRRTHPRVALLSGSGSAVFGVYGTRGEALDACSTLGDAASSCRVHLVRTLASLPAPVVE